MTGRLATLGGLAHPEWVAGRRLWLDPVMADIIDKIRDGDPTRGWEGDPQLAVFSQDTPEGMRWELMRLEDDNEYRLVARSKPGVVFDERVIDMLVRNDRNRNPNRDLHAEIVAHNERRDAEVDKAADEYIVEEVAPRLHHALKRDRIID